MLTWHRQRSTLSVPGPAKGSDLLAIVSVIKGAGPPPRAHRQTRRVSVVVVILVFEIKPTRAEMAGRNNTALII